MAPHGVMAGGPEEAFENAFSEVGLTHPSWEARTSAALVACRRLYAAGRCDIVRAQGDK